MNKFYSPKGVRFVFNEPTDAATLVGIFLKTTSDLNVYIGNVYIISYLVTSILL